MGGADGGTTGCSDGYVAVELTNVDNSGGSIDRIGEEVGCGAGIENGKASGRGTIANGGQ